ncbi:hypothetical protein [Erwinia sp. S38]|uniref:hypothetical protein n=1 Tax=Erwinia sp. S38 TaxID=2769338 RepID=UPI00190A50F6|nr:hypothetical protein [Erwinia sp. S38]MBK0001232.1 hypothetical protein [Erwinia sp. S38]
MKLPFIKSAFVVIFDNNKESAAMVTARPDAANCRLWRSLFGIGKGDAAQRKAATTIGVNGCFMV